MGIRWPLSKTGDFIAGIERTDGDKSWHRASGGEGDAIKKSAVTVEPINNSPTTSFLLLPGQKKRRSLHFPGWLWKI